MSYLSQSIREKIFARNKIPAIALLVMVTVYVIVFFYLTALKLQVLGMHAWDFGIYLQAIHTTVNSGRLFYATPELPYTLTAIPPGTEFAVHFSPVLFLVVPFYALLQSPMTILLIKSIVISLGAVPVFFLAKRTLGKSWWGLVFAGGYLLYPLVQGINWYDFEPHIFFPTFALFTILFLELERKKLALVFGILSLFSVEIAPFFMIALGLSYLIIRRNSLFELIRKRRFGAILKFLPVTLIFVAAMWLVLVFSTSAVLGWQTSFHLSNIRRVSMADSLNVLGALSYDWQTKLLYLSLVLGPFAFLSLLDPVRLFPGALWVLYALLSNYSPYYSISFQYPSFVVPFVLASAIFGLKKLQARSNKYRNRTMSLALCIVIGVATVASSPVGPYHIGNHVWAQPFGIPTMTPHKQSLYDLIKLIPANASVLTSNDLFPQVAQRINAYVFPFSATFQRLEDFSVTLDNYLQESDYILYDPLSDQAATVLLPSRSAFSDFGLYAESDGAILLKKAHTGAPVIFVPIQKVFRSDDLLSVNSSTIKDSSSESGKVLYHFSNTSTSDFWYGPGYFLARGTYSIDFRLKLGDTAGNSSSHVISVAAVEWPASATIDMSGSPSMWFIPTIVWQSVPQRILLANDLHTSAFNRTGSYQTFNMRLVVEQPGGFEFVGLNVPNATVVYLDYVRLIQVSP